MQTILQQLMCNITRRLPRFKGLGRIVLAGDALFRSKYGDHSFELLANVNQGCRILVDGRVLEQRFAYYYGEWESDLIRAAIKHYGGGAFYDVGGSIGLYAIAVGKHCREIKQGFVRTFEPFPANLDRMRHNLALNSLCEMEVKIHATALNRVSGVLQVALVADGLPGNAKVVREGGVEVPVQTLDSIWEQNGREEVGFIKIDTEGFDGEVLFGAQRLLTQWRPSLLVEFNRERMANLGFSFSESWRLLTVHLGYQPYKVDSRGNPQQINEPRDRENILFLAKEGNGAACGNANGS